VLEFRRLGSLEVLGESGLLPLGGQRQRAVLAVLLLEAGRVVSTERLVSQLWGENPPRTATPSLQNFVSTLRKQLPEGLLVTKPPGYVLRIAPEQVDLGRFEQLVAEARQADPGGRALKLRSALELWRGEPLADFRYEEWAQGEIARLEARRLAVLE
jgi:DNA-binding SARP family transcriptional activator